MKELRERMRKAFESFGFFIFEEDLLKDVEELLEIAHLRNTLRIAKLGRSQFDSIPGAENVEYYAVILNVRDCVKSEDVEKCVTEKRKSVVEALAETEVEGKPKKRDSLRELYEMLSKE
ncbi:hypothetical protein [Ignicoccus islandicus]|nr:hypothetical protein [Ignicoccus islandicus]